ncbi:metallophosphoesterase [Chitinispirillales bacterium ANBcel5]|uniref:metallophosphoesterase family protein n=1 Tax=Cellulosispirillum alkaliphilum TaxID=3039283 RepID=UPI002A544F1D|nr:metallophosphoesterase [Chitinispirillales bacterium ANBcel5]
MSTKTDDPISRKVSFIHISDTHLGENKDFILYNQNTYQKTTNLIKAINSFSAPVDFVIHTGDVVNEPTKASYELVKDIFSSLNHPILYVTGNHDYPEHISWLNSSNQSGFDLVPLTAGSYHFNYGHYKVLSLDCKGSPQIDPHGDFGYLQEKDLVWFLRRFDDDPKIIFTHFPPVSLDVPWIDREMLLFNGERFHDTLLKYGNNVLGVFIGHIHHRLVLNKDGILYTSAPSPICQFNISPLDQKVAFDCNVPASFNYITLVNNNILIKEITTESP